jgi:hypothetical protein
VEGGQDDRKAIADSLVITGNLVGNYWPMWVPTRATTQSIWSSRKPSIIGDSSYPEALRGGLRRSLAAPHGRWPRASTALFV